MRDYIEMAAKSRASDLHLTDAVAPMVRIDGALVPLTDKKLSKNEVSDLAHSVMNEKQIQTLREMGEVDFAFSIPQIGRFRINVFNQSGGMALALRILSSAIPDPAYLGIPKSVIELTSKKRGLVLVTGATGSGKSTTLAAMIDIINSNYPSHIITLEDPIEYIHSHKRGIVNQREMGEDSLSYANALRAALRQDPDVILVGEMRDLETISIAITAAETGHLVLSTLHTIGAANTIDRIIDVFPPHQQQQIRIQLSEVLECVLSQNLMPKAAGEGRIAAFEVMHVNGAIRNMIRDSKTFQIESVIQMNKKHGMITMDDAILEHYLSGQISKETALGFAQNSNDLLVCLGD